MLGCLVCTVAVLLPINNTGFLKSNRTGFEVPVTFVIN